MSEARTDLWHVQLASGDLEVMTLDQLDDAFNSDRIDENTMVLQGGALKWSRLGEILGLDEEEEQPLQYIPQLPAPQSAQVQPLPAFASPLETANRQLVVPTPLFVERPSQRVSATGPDSFDAMTPSVRPMSFDIAASSTNVMPDDDFDPDMLTLRPSKRKFVVIGLAAGLLLAIGGVGLSKVAGASSLDAAATNANISSAVVAASQPAAAPPSNNTIAADSLPGSRLSDDQKKMLAGMDKKLEDAQKAKADAAAEHASKRAAHGKYKKGKTGLKEGGDEHDPLNATLHKTTGKW